MARTRIGFVGTGGIAHRHIDGYRQVVSERAAVAAVCDLRKDVVDAFADRYGIEYRFTDVGEMLASGEIDVAVDLTPPAARDAVVLPALEHGVHILVEKPFGQDARRAVEYVRAADEAGCTLAVNQNLRWFPEVRHTRALLDEGTYGPVRFVKHDHFQNRPLAPGVWRAEERRLEMAIFGIHIIDRIQWLAGSNPTSVAAATFRDPNGALPGEQFATLLMRFDEGIVAQMTSSWLSKSLSESRLRVDADHGSITAIRPHSTAGEATWSAAPEGGDEIVRRFRDEGRFDASFGYSMAALLDGLDAGVEPVNSGRNNLKTMGIMDAAYLSAERGGELVTVEEALGVDLPTIQAEGHVHA
jgi:D-apiose dehydrogenase